MLTFGWGIPELRIKFINLPSEECTSGRLLRFAQKHLCRSLVILGKILNESIDVREVKLSIQLGAHRFLVVDMVLLLFIVYTLDVH